MEAIGVNLQGYRVAQWIWGPHDALDPTSYDYGRSRGRGTVIDEMHDEVNSNLGWDTGSEASGATRNSESDHCQTLPAAQQAAAARGATSWAQLPIGLTSDL